MHWLAAEEVTSSAGQGRRSFLLGRKAQSCRLPEGREKEQGKSRMVPEAKAPVPLVTGGGMGCTLDSKNAGW